eukprot:1956254-Pyramimonas_sp.AAC.1
MRVRAGGSLGAAGRVLAPEPAHLRGPLLLRAAQTLDKCAAGPVGVAWIHGSNYSSREKEP